MNIKILVGTLTVLFWLLLITQVLIPIYKKKFLFPLFRKSRRDLEERIRVANEREEVSDIEEQVKDLETNVNNKGET